MYHAFNQAYHELANHCSLPKAARQCFL